MQSRSIIGLEIASIEITTSLWTLYVCFKQIRFACSIAESARNLHLGQPALPQKKDLKARLVLTMKPTLMYYSKRQKRGIMHI